LPQKAINRANTVHNTGKLYSFQGYLVMFIFGFLHMVSVCVLTLVSLSSWLLIWFITPCVRCSCHIIL